MTSHAASPALSSLFQTTYNLVATAAPEHPHLYDLSSALDEAPEQIWIDTWGHMTPEGNRIVSNPRGFYGKYLRKGDGFIALRMLVHHGRALRRWVRGTLQHDAEAARMGRAYFTGMMPGIIAGMRKRTEP